MKKTMFLVPLILCFLTSCVSENANSQYIAIRQKETFEVIAVLERYHDDNEIYPDSLVDLIPQYIPSIPESSDGKGYQYYRREGYKYLLCFDTLEKNSRCCYIKHIDDWDCTQGVDH